jgi:DNA-directed RNA polymerase specialized sigma24 family protein
MPIKLENLTLYSVEELATLFGVQENTVRNLFKSGKLKGRKLARRWYTTAEELRDYFSRSEAETLQGGA